MWADYFSVTTPLTSPKSSLGNSEIPNIHNIITYNGLKPQIKVNGNSKTFTSTFYNHNNIEQSLYVGKWKFMINGIDVTSLDKNLLEIITNHEDSNLNKNQIKVRFVGDDNYIGKTLTVINYFDDIQTSIDMAIVAL